MSNKKLLWLDDIRDPRENDWLRYSPIGKENVEMHWVLTEQEFKNWILQNGLPDAICFDHDLGTDNGDGYNCAKWLVDYCIQTKQKLPKYASQSANPVGKENILQLLQNFERFLTDINQ